VRKVQVLLPGRIMRRLRTTIAAAAALIGGSAMAQQDFDAPFPAHRMIGNIYFVGTEGLGSFLITTPEGHILINSDFERTVPAIRRSVESLGFEFSDIEIVLGSHAHGDHMQGDALVKQLTGAEVMAMAADVPALRAMRPDGKEHPIDRILEDGDTVSLGGTTLTAHLTPGHTKGCTTWSLAVEEAGRTYNAVIVCSFGVNDNYVLVGNRDYPNIVADYVATFAKARALEADVFLGSHGFWFDLGRKYELLQSRGPNDPNPYVDPEGYRAHIDMQEARFRSMLDQQRGAQR
jgi:metallo-beta-lactamase class B